MTGDDDEMFMTRSLNVTPKTREQHLIVRSDKSLAYETINKRLRSTFCITEATDRHEASRGFSPTAELLVCIFEATRLYAKSRFLSEIKRLKR